MNIIGRQKRMDCKGETLTSMGFELTPCMMKIGLCEWHGVPCGLCLPKLYYHGNLTISIVKLSE